VLKVIGSDRLNKKIEELSAIRRIESPRVSRLVYSAENKDAFLLVTK